MGPWLTPSVFIADPHNLAIQLWVNDKLMQNSSSRDMYFTIPEQIEYLSQLITLLPGDVIATGTPPGVGHARGLYLKPGDVVTITIEVLGSIRNPVIAGFYLVTRQKSAGDKKVCDCGQRPGFGR